MRNAVVRSQGTTRENRPRVAESRTDPEPRKAEPTPSREQATGSVLVGYLPGYWQRGRFSLAIGAAGLQLTLNQSWSSSPQLSISFTSLSSLEWSGRFVSDVIVARISIS